MALGHEFRNFRSGEGFSGEGFTISSPFRAGAVFVGRDNRSRDGRIGRNSVALGFAEGDDAVFNNRSHLGIHDEVRLDVREFLVPTIEAVAFEDRISRSNSAGIEGNALAVNEDRVERDKLHVEGVGMALYLA